MWRTSGSWWTSLMHPCHHASRQRSFGLGQHAVPMSTAFPPSMSARPTCVAENTPYSLL